MVKDNVTGLIWENKTDDGTIHDKDNRYTWSDSFGVGSNTMDFIYALNSSHFGGYSDWRLPTITELAYIINYSVPSPGPTIDTGFFSNTAASGYWSSTTSKYVSGNIIDSIYNAWGVGFGNGYVANYDKSGSNYVRAVRGGQSGALGYSVIRSFDTMASVLSDDVSTATGGYADNGDGTVTDTSTVLMWQQQASSSTQTWEQALAYCEGLNLGGHTDWRLPTIKELRSLVDYSRYNPAINTTYFPNALSSYYWSSTTYASNAYVAWGVYFFYGDDSVSSGKPSSKYVRAVRGGQPGSLGHLVISPASRNVAKDAGTTTFSVSNTGTETMPWTAAVTSDSSWLSIISGASGTDTGTITCSFTANTSTSSRTATIRVTAIGTIDSPVDVTVTQTLAPAPTLLWAGNDGRASIWTMDMDANKTGEMLYGPYPGWTAKSYHKNSDGTANMLWGRTDGYVSLWMMDASGNPTSMSYYGPYPDWTARGYHRNSDGTANMLWGRIDGYVSLWMMDASGNPSMSYYGPYEGWTATCYHGNSDGAANMLWVRTDGYVSLWTMDASGNPTSMSYYGPYEGWTAKSYYRNSDGTANMLWGRADGYVSLWLMNASGNPISMSYFGPDIGWTAQDYD
jgi:hypothetical protein